jgi:transcriptional regulator with XRE-family HTH domain
MIKNRMAAPILPESSNHSLCHYVRRLLAEKSLSLADVELRASGKISDSRIAGLAAGDCDNLRCETLRALARGLGIAEERLFAVAIGMENAEVQEYDFLVLYRKYNDLCSADKQETDGLLALLHREIERLRTRTAGSRQMIQSANEDGTYRQNGKPDIMPQGAGLKSYLCRLLKENQITLKEIEQRSNQKISVSYLRNLIFDGMTNLTLEKIKALACGLQVSPQEIFAVLEDQSTERRAFKSSLFAALYHKYKALPAADKNELLLLMKLVDGEIDRRQMQQLRRTERQKLMTLEANLQRKAS